MMASTLWHQWQRCSPTTDCHGQTLIAQIDITVGYPDLSIDYPKSGDTVPEEFLAYGRVEPPNSTVTVKLNDDTPIPPKDVNVPGDGSWSTKVKAKVGRNYTLKAWIVDTETAAEHNDITVVKQLGGYPSSNSISIGYPGAGSKVSQSFQATGQVYPPNCSVTVTLNGNSVSASVPGDGSWSASFQNITPGTYSLTASIDGTTTSATNFNITVDP